MDERQLIKAHKISLNNRSFGVVTGVREVISFDALEIILDTEQGLLIIKGEDLHVTRLTVEKGEVEVTGSVDCMMYSDVEEKKRSRENFIARLFQ
jgi:sporulation protein YabP